MAALTAKLVGGGYERPDADKSLPLDVHYAKLAEWLVSGCGCGTRQLGVGSWGHAGGALSASRSGPPLNAQVDRKQVPTDWSLKLQAIQVCQAGGGPLRAAQRALRACSTDCPSAPRAQAKAAEAARELPPGFLGQFEGGGGDAAADYFLAQQVRVLVGAVRVGGSTAAGAEGRGAWRRLSGLRWAAAEGLLVGGKHTRTHARDWLPPAGAGQAERDR